MQKDAQDLVVRTSTKSRGSEAIELTDALGSNEQVQDKEMVRNRTTSNIIYPFTEMSS